MAFFSPQFSTRWDVKRFPLVSGRALKSINFATIAVGQWETAAAAKKRFIQFGHQRDNLSLCSDRRGITSVCVRLQQRQGCLLWLCHSVLSSRTGGSVFKWQNPVGGRRRGLSAWSQPRQSPDEITLSWNVQREKEKWRRTGIQGHSFEFASHQTALLPLRAESSSRSLPSTVSPGSEPRH